VRNFHRLVTKRINMLQGSTRRHLLALVLGLLIWSFQVAGATQETKQPELRTLPDGTVTAAASQKTASSPASKPIGINLATTEPFENCCKQIKKILDENKITGPRRKILIREMIDQHTGFPTLLSPLVKDYLYLGCQRFDEMEFVEASIALRGLAVVAKPKSNAALAETIGADVWLTGELRKINDGIELKIDVVRRSGNQLLGVAKVLLPPEVLPPGVNIIAPNLKEAQVNQKIEEQIAPLASAQDDASLKVEVWVDRGEGAVYVEGEELIAMVRANRDAYILLFYTNAANQTYQIFPNEHHPEGKIRGNVVTRIPEPQDAFIFRIEAPFGIESIMALASSKPVEDLKMATSDAGPFQQIRGGLPEIRGLAVERRKAQKADLVRNSVVLTTIPAVRTSDPSWD
jgi:Domain of unknown function (DUF4384)